MKLTKDNFSATTMQEMQASLDGLERREWWRWAAALLIMLFLTVGVLVLALPEMRRDSATQQDQLNRAVYGLIALVVIFDAFAIYQQVLISRLRKQLAGQIGMLATLEALKPSSAPAHPGRKERRRTSRHPFDQRLKIKLIRNGKENVYYGRVIDISEFGLGAVLSGEIEVNSKVMIEFSSGSGNLTLNLPAMVRYGNGFHYGFEFGALSPEDRDHVRKLCMSVDSIPAMQIQ
jgi:hypothetical protein